MTTERDMLDLIHARYATAPEVLEQGLPPRFHVIEKPSAPALYRYGDKEWTASEYGTDRILDALVLDRYLENGVRCVHGFEVKVSRSDWLRELREPCKAAAWTRYCHRFWLVVHDTSIVKPGELPDGWGLLAPNSAGRLLARPKAQLLTKTPDPLPGIADLVWRAIKTHRQQHERTSV